LFFSLDMLDAVLPAPLLILGSADTGFDCIITG
jgi:hypothetical protein